MTLFDGGPVEPVEFCWHGRVIAECPFCNREATPDRLREFQKLARADDPHTSKAAARSLNLDLKVGHRAVLDWLENRTATDDEIADAMVAEGHTDRTETARRWVRTLREVHGRIEPALDDYGAHMTRVNRSGRTALAWRTKA